MQRNGGKEIERLERSRKYDEEERSAEIKKYYYGGLLGCLFAALFTDFMLSINIEKKIEDIIYEMLGCILFAVFSYIVFSVFQHMSMNETAKRNFWIAFVVMTGGIRAFVDMKIKT